MKGNVFSNKKDDIINYKGLFATNIEIRNLKEEYETVFIDRLLYMICPSCGKICDQDNGDVDYSYGDFFLQCQCKAVYGICYDSIKLVKSDDINILDKENYQDIYNNFINNKLIKNKIKKEIEDIEEYYEDHKEELRLKYYYAFHFKYFLYKENINNNKECEKDCESESESDCESESEKDCESENNDYNYCSYYKNYNIEENNKIKYEKQKKLELEIDNNKWIKVEDPIFGLNIIGIDEKFITTCYCNKDEKYYQIFKFGFD